MKIIILSAAMVMLPWAFVSCHKDEPKIEPVIVLHPSPAPVAAPTPVPTPEIVKKKDQKK